MMSPEMRHLLYAAVLVAACHGNDPTKGGAGTASSAPATTPSTMPVPAEPAKAEPAKADPPKAPVADGPKVFDNGATKVSPESKAPPPPGGHDFTAEAKAM